MKRSEKTTTKSSAKVKAKVKELAQKSSGKKKLKQPAALGLSTPSVNQQNSKTSDKVFEGAVHIDKLPFKEQADLIFNPLQGMNKASVIGKNETKDPFAPSFTTVTGSKE